MSDIDTIRQRDADSAETWFKDPPLGACGRAFIDRRWLLAEVDRQRGTLSLAEEGLANYAQENEQLKADNERLRHRCAALAFLQYGGPSPGAECSGVPQSPVT